MPSMRKSSTGGLVYSTEGGRMCPACRQPVSACICRSAAQVVPAGDGIVRVSRETKGRGGKTVTLVRGVPLEGDALAALGKRLRTSCGSGGTLKEGVFELQGDHVERVMALLAQEGYKVRRAG